MYFDLLDDLRKLRNNMGRFYDGLDYTTYPPVNIYDKEDYIEVEALLPGVDKDKIDIDFENNVLTISGDKPNEYINDDKITYVRQERDYGKFNKSLRIRIPIDTDNINATYEKGILKISMKKSEEAKPKKIAIK